MKGTVSQRIKFLRTHLGLSQADFAAKINLTQGAVAAMETGRSQPSRMALNAISTQYSVSLKWLEDGEGEMLLITELPKPERNAEAEAFLLIERIRADHARDKQELFKIIQDYREQINNYAALLKKHKVLT